MKSLKLEGCGHPEAGEKSSSWYEINVDVT
jgi:hypothetical protein